MNIIKFIALAVLCERTARYEGRLFKSKKIQELIFNATELIITVMMVVGLAIIW